MRRHAPMLVLVLVLAALVGGLAVLFRLRIAQGDVFPPYSSMRSDPLGTRALHDSFAAVPTLTVERYFKRLVDIPSLPTRTIIMAGGSLDGWKHLSREEFDAIDAAVRAGSRLVVTMHAQKAPTREEEEKLEKAREKREKRAKREAEDEDDEKRNDRPKMTLAEIERRWGMMPKQRRLTEPDAHAQAMRTNHPRAAGLPEGVAWRSDVYLDVVTDAGWNVIYRYGNEPALVERTLGNGSIVLAGDSYFLSNEALQKNRASALLAWIVGPHTRVTFDEAHLGVQADPGVAALARRYGMAGAFFTLLVLAALFVWRQMALFVPPAEAEQDLALTYHPAAGLEALLRRSVAVNDLPGVCVSEWKPTARASDRARVDAAVAALPKNASVVARYNAALQALRRR